MLYRHPCRRLDFANDLGAVIIMLCLHLKSRLVWIGRKKSLLEDNAGIFAGKKNAANYSRMKLTFGVSASS